MTARTVQSRCVRAYAFTGSEIQVGGAWTDYRFSLDPTIVEPAMRFLVVDDSTTMRRIIINTLNKVGYKDCAEASNGREGMERLAEAAVDIVITDWNMPEMSGIEFIRAI